MSPSISRDTTAEKSAAMEPDSRRQPPWHVVVLGIFATPPLYIAFWAYKTIRDLKRESIEVNGHFLDPRAQAAGVQPPTPVPLPPRKDDVNLDEHTKDTLAIFGRQSPGLRGLGILVPLLNVYLLTTLLIGLCNLVPDQESFPRKHPLAATFLVLASFLLFVALGRLPGEWYLISLLGLLPIAFAQNWLNKYWAMVEDPDVFVRYGFSVVEMIVIIIGATVLGLAVAGLMIGVR